MSKLNEVFEYIRNTIVDMKDMEPEDITLDTSIDELGFDSLDYVEIQVNVKREYCVTLVAAQFEARIKTIGQLCSYIAEESIARETLS